MPTLTETLKAHCQDTHSRIESRFLASGLVCLLSSRDNLALYFIRLHSVYEQLEKHIRLIRDVYPEFEWETLFRKQKLEHDITFLLSDRSIRPLTSNRPDLLYVHHLDRLSCGRPEAYLAHAYVRYMGDVYGGQIISRLINARYGFSKNTLHFFQFGDASSRPGKIGKQFKDSLNTLAFDDTVLQLMKSEARMAFELSAALLEPSALKATRDTELALAS